MSNWQKSETNLQLKFKTQGLSPNVIRSFRRLILDYFRKNERDFPWRHTTDPYHILISEIMLQQTQTERVTPKYLQFIEKFPDFKSLATASLKDVLAVWQGLGYNRRALMLKKAAEQVMKNYNGKLPEEIDLLEKLPGIGKYTAAAVRAFAFNKPAVFIETNIRSVFIHIFFSDTSGKVSDAQLFPIIEKTLPKRNPQQWYSALMDYGAMIKNRGINPSRKSASHIRQAGFKGSDRQIRGAILKLLLKNDPMPIAKIKKSLPFTPERITRNLQALHTEGMIKKGSDGYHI